MRKYLGLAVLTGAIGALAVGCGTKGGGGATIRQGTGSTGSGSNSSGGAGSIFNPGSGGNSIFDPGSGPNNYGGAPADPEPGNPNVTHADCQPGACLDFPEAPIMGEGVPMNAPTLFGDKDNFTDGGLCVLEPQLGVGGKPGAMLPSNWARPRFRVGGVPAGIDLLEIRIHSAAEKNDLVAYTKYVATGGVAPSWYLPKEIWTGKAPADAMPPRASGYGFANNSAGQAISVTIRGINSASPGKPVGMKGELNIAPVVATGSMVFWTVNSGKVTADSSKLLGFAVGDEGVANALTLKDVKWAGEIGEDGAVLRGFYDKEPLKDFKNGDVRCIGCHVTIPPDANGSASVLFGDDWPWSLAGAQLNGGAIPTALAAGAQAIMRTPWWGQQHMSVGHWKTGDHTIISSYGSTFISGKDRKIPWEKLPAYNGTDGATMDDKIKWHQLAWINADYNATIPVTISADNDYGKPELDQRNMLVTMAKGTGWGIIATGDKNVSDVSPNLSHDGNTIVYVASDYTPDGHPDATATVADVRTVPYANRAGGASAPLAGASDANFLEYYPSFSQDDKLIAFTQAPKKTSATSAEDGPYYNRNGKIMVIPAAGGTATELVANDPGTCGGDNVSAGIINSWPKWSPDAVPVKVNNKTYYFLVFSSARKYGDEFSKQFDLEKNMASSFAGLTHSSQLYLAAVVVDNMTGAITTYPAVYIWNQNRTPGANGTTATGLQYSNLTPAWDPIKLPDLVIPDVPIETIPK